MLRLRPFSAQSALERLRNLSSDESGGSDDSEQEEEQSENIPTAAPNLIQSSYSSDSKVEAENIEVSAEQNTVEFKSSRIWCNFERKG